MIIGVDEVGRGAWAGPLVAGAVILTRSIVGLKDSKQLSRAQREKLTERIQRQALATGLGWVSPAEIDSLGLTLSIRVAMQRALQEIDETYDEVIIDGNYNFLPEVPYAKTVIKGDQLVPAVSAASIIAKVARDNYMRQTACLYAKYGFEYHVGYGTRRHAEALKLYGACNLHRLSFKPIQTIGISKTKP